MSRLGRSFGDFCRFLGLGLGDLGRRLGCGRFGGLAIPLAQIFAFLVFLVQQGQLVGVLHIEIYRLRDLLAPRGRQILGIKEREQDFVADRHICKLFDRTPFARIVLAPCPRIRAVRVVERVQNGADKDLHRIGSFVRLGRRFGDLGGRFGDLGRGFSDLGGRFGRFFRGRFRHGLRRNLIERLVAVVVEHVGGALVGCSVSAEPSVAVVHLVTREISGHGNGKHGECLLGAAPILGADRFFLGRAGRGQVCILGAVFAAPVMHLPACFQLIHQIADNADRDGLGVAVSSCGACRFGCADADCSDGHHGQEHADRKQ